MKNSLSASEWTLLALFAIIMGSLVFISKFNAIRASDAIEKIPEGQIQILVTIDGAVKKPGQYLVAEGSPAISAVRKAKPTLWADLKPFKEPIISPAHLTVPELKEIRVYVAGEIGAPVELVLPAGSRISDLKSKIVFTPETDIAFFKRRKLLRDEEKIEVPKKKVERN